MEKEEKPKEKKTEIKKEKHTEKKEDGKTHPSMAELEKKPEQKTEEKPKEEKEIEKPAKEKPKKTEAVVNAHNLPISTKHSAAICRFIKNKKIENAIADLEQVLMLKKAVPMKGEIPHRKGRIMAGRFPKKATQNFIKLLKTLSANANYNSLENPVIVEAVANMGSRPYGKFGAVRKKRTHVKLKAVESRKK